MELKHQLFDWIENLLKKMGVNNLIIKFIEELLSIKIYREKVCTTLTTDIGSEARRAIGIIFMGCLKFMTIIQS
jgi:hypothetical protein